MPQINYKIGYQVDKTGLNDLKASLQQLQKLKISDVAKINKTDTQTAIRSLAEIKYNAEAVQKALSHAYNTKLNTVNIEKFNQSLKNSNTSLQEIYRSFKNGGAVGENTFKSLTNQITNTTTQLKESHKVLDKIGTTLANSLKWNVASSVINSFSNSIQQAWGFTKSLDSSLNNIRVVTGKSADQMANFAIEANKAAKELGKTTTDYTDASLIYYQQGLSDKQVKARTEITLKAANVTGQQPKDVSEQLTAVWNGYKATAEQAELYVDRLAAVAANTASNLEELSTGMSKVASAAAMLGVGEDQLAAQLSTIIAATRQAPESVGTALRTVYARITDIKAGVDEEGVSLGRYSQQMANLGFNVLDLNGNLRNMGEVIEEIGGKWNDLTKEQQISLAQTMAGQRQYSNLVALFDNFAEYNRTLEIAQNAQGTLSKQQDIAMESLSKHLEQLSASVEKIFINLVDNDSLKTLIDGLSGAADKAALFVSSIGGGAGVLKTLGSLGVSVFSQQIGKSIQITIDNFKQAKQYANSLKTQLDQMENIKAIQSSEIISDKQNFLAKVRSGIISQQDLTSIQKSFDGIISTGGQIDKINQRIKLTSESFKELGVNFSQASAQFKNENGLINIEELFGSEEGIEEVKTALAGLETELNNVKNVSQDALSNLNTQLQNFNKIKPNIKNISVSNFKDEAKGMRDSVLNTIMALKQDINGASIFNGLDENSKQVISNIEKSFGRGGSISKAITNLKAQTKENVFNELSLNAQQVQTIVTKEIEIIEQKIDSLKQKQIDLGLNPEDAETLRNLESRLISFKKALDETKAHIKQGFDIQSLVQGLGGLARFTSSIQTIKNLGTVWASSASAGQKFQSTIMNLGMAIPIAVSGLTSLQKALAATSLASLANPITATIAVIGSLVAAYGVWTNSVEENKKARIEAANKTIEEQNQIQQEIEQKKNLEDSLSDLSKKYEEGKIDRLELKDTIEDLIQQYGLQGDAADNLRSKYTNLTQAIRDLREENATKGLNSAKEQLQSYKTLILETEGFSVKILNDLENVGYRWTEAYEGFLNGYDGDKEASYQIVQYAKNTSPFLQALGELKHGGVYNNGSGSVGLGFKGENTVENQIAFYNQLQQKVKEIQKTANKEIMQDEFYQATNKWLSDNRKTFQGYQQALEKISKHSAVIQGLNLNFSEIDNADQYIEKRQQLINKLAEQEDIDEEGAVTAADVYLSKYERNAFNKFNGTLKAVEEIKEKLGQAIEGPEKATQERALNLIKGFSLQQLDIFNQLDISSHVDSYEELLKTVKAISDVDFSNFLTLSDIGEWSEQATDIYNFYGSLADQLKDSKKKTIKKEEFAKLDADIQSFFTLLADGTYKLTGDAKQFYNLVNEKQLSGFKTIMASIDQTRQGIEEINNKNKDGNYYNKLASSTGAEFAQEKINYMIQSGRYEEDSQTLDKFKLYQTKIKAETLNNTELKEINDLFIDLKDQSQALRVKLENLNATYLQSEIMIGRSAKSLKELRQMYQNNTISLKAFTTAAIELDQQTDIQGLDSEQIENTAEYLQNIAGTTDDLNVNLKDNSQAAEIVAKSILKMDKGVQALSKDWESWSDILANSSATSNEYREALIGTQDALGQLLDINKDFISEDFIKQHFDEISKAAKGDQQAIDSLKEALGQDLIAKIILDNNIQNKDQVLSLFQSLKAEIPDIEVGTVLETGPFVEQLQKFIEACGLTVDQANTLFDTLGFDATFAKEQIPIDQEIPSTVTKTKVAGWEETDMELPFGNSTFKVKLPTFITQTEEGPKTPVSGVVEAYAMGMGKTVPKITTLTKKATGSFNNSSSRNKGTSGGKKSSKGSKGGSSSKKDTKKNVKDQRDIYHDINIEIQQINKNLDRVQKQQNRLYGKQLLANLGKQSKLLEEQKAKLKEKLKLQESDLANQKEILKSLGVTFDKYGNISNYMDILGNKQNSINSLTKTYNQLVQSYNKAGNEEVKKSIDERLTQVGDSIKQGEQALKELKTKINNYDNLKNKDMQDIIDQIEQATQKQVEINIQKFNMQVEIRLRLGQAERDWNNFKRNVLNKTDIIKDTDFSKIFKDALKDSEDIFSYFNVGGANGTIQTLTKQILDIKKQIEDIDQKGTSAIYGDNKAKAMQDLQNDVKQLMSQMEDIEGLIDNIDSAYLETIDDVNAQLDKQIENYKLINDLISHNIDLMQLIYGEKNYAAMDKYYNQMAQNNLQSLDMLKRRQSQTLKYWQEATANGDIKAAEKWEQVYKNTTQQLNEMIMSSIENLQNKYTNAIERIYDELDSKITDGKGLDYVSMEWDLINKNADQYLDTINAAYAIQQTSRKYQKAINETSSLKNQQAIKTLMQQQVELLKAKQKITEYDVQRAEKLLQVEQARIALEDAQSAKTSMRLKRDSQGNYSYEYVADDDAIDQAKSNYDAAMNDLYNFDKNRFNSNAAEILAAYKEYISQRKEIEEDFAGDKAKQTEQLALLDEQWQKYITNIADEQLVARKNLMGSAFDEYGDLYELNAKNFQDMTEQEKEMFMGQLVPTWDSGVEHMAEKFAGQDGFLVQCKDAFDELKVENENFGLSIQEVTEAAGVELQKVKDGTLAVDENIKQLIIDNNTLLTGVENQISDISALRTEVHNLADEYLEVYDNAKNAVDVIHNFIQAQEKAAAASAAAAKEANNQAVAVRNLQAAQSGNGGYSTNLNSKNSTSGSSSGDGSTPNNLGKTPPYSKRYSQDEIIKGITEAIYINSSSWANGTDNSEWGIAQKIKNVLKEKYSYSIIDTIVNAVINNLQRKATFKATPLYPNSFDTGGYTGDWLGSEGKLALLHSKELVLNKTDTSNLLNTIEILRTITSSLNGAMFLRNSGIKSGFGKNFNPNEDGIEQNVHIDASFPNVNSKQEIEQAFSELVNLAAQRAMRKR